MKLAVIKTGGKQYLVSPGTKLKIEKLPLAAVNKSGEVVFDSVLLTDDGNALKMGKPNLSGTKITAKKLADGRHPKITIIKFKQKSRYRVKQGHKQPYTEVEITGGF